METKVTVQNCKNCVFSVLLKTFYDEVPYYVCKLQKDFISSLKAVDNVALCKHKITFEEVESIVKADYGPIPKF